MEQQLSIGIALSMSPLALVTTLWCVDIFYLTLSCEFFIDLKVEFLLFSVLL